MACLFIGRPFFMKIDKTLIKIYDRLYDSYGPQHWWPGDTRFEIIVGAILTQNTAWSNVEKAIKNLKRARALSAGAMKRISMKKLAGLIRPAGYYNIKAKRLKHFIGFLFDQYGGDLRKMARRETAALRHELLGVNGIGPETCDSILLYAFNRPAFVIDAYTKRVFSRHGFYKDSVDYHLAQDFFVERLPADARLFNEYHALIVRLAKEHCRTVPECEGCPINGLKCS